MTILNVFKRKVFYYSWNIFSMIPSFVWILLNRRVWDFDPSQYGQASVELYHTLLYYPTAWFSKMMYTLNWDSGAKPPAISWLGMWFVAGGKLFGSVDSALLFSIILTQVGSLLLIFETVIKLSKGRLMVGLAASFLVASAPLFVTLSHLYFAEPVQTLSISCFITLMGFAPSLGKLNLIFGLVGGTCLALLTKASSPIYIIGPFLGVLYFLFKPSRDKIFPPPECRLWLLIFYAGVLLLTVFTIGWYFNNFEAVVQHAHSSATSNLWGTNEGLIQEISYWSNALRINFFGFISLMIVGGVILLSVMQITSTKFREINYFDLNCFIAVSQIILVILAFSLSSNEDQRYLHPLIPYMAIILGWGLYRLNQRLITSICLFGLIIQMTIVNLQSFGKLPQTPGRVLFTTLDRDPTSLQILGQVLHETCPGSYPEGQPWIVVGFYQSYLNDSSLNYQLTKNNIHTENLVPCHYLSLPLIHIFEGKNDLDTTWKILAGFPPEYFFVTLSRTALETLPTCLNKAALPIYDKVTSCPDFKLVRMIEDSDHGNVLIFKRTPLKMYQSDKVER